MWVRTQSGSLLDIDSGTFIRNDGSSLTHVDANGETTTIMRGTEQECQAALDRLALALQADHDHNHITWPWLVKVPVP
jgi:hypothetical protein